jgi:hypothetical protein
MGERILVQERANRVIEAGLRVGRPAYGGAHPRLIEMVVEKEILRRVQGALDMGRGGRRSNVSVQ